jgi:hypothetical protein
VQRIEEEIQERVHEKKPLALERVNPRAMKRLNFTYQAFRAAIGGVPNDFVKQVVEHLRVSRTVRLRKMLYYRYVVPDHFAVPWRIAAKHETINAF